MTTLMICMIASIRLQEGTGAGSILTGLTADEREFYFLGRRAFMTLNSVQGERYFPNTEAGLGPLYNLDSCAGCHAHPEPGGSSPPKNPQIAGAARNGVVPTFLKEDGPALQVRIPGKSSGVHPLFSIVGRKDAGTCSAKTADFEEAYRKGSLMFRIPIPLFGAGYIAAIPAAEIIANATRDRAAKSALGIHGLPNWIGPGILGRFGWKAHSPSLELFSAEAYRNEQGVTNEFFPDELAEGPTSGCDINPVPEDRTLTSRRADGTSNVLRFAYFARFLAPPSDSTGLFFGVLALPLAIAGILGVLNAGAVAGYGLLTHQDVTGALLPALAAGFVGGLGLFMAAGVASPFWGFALAALIGAGSNILQTFLTNPNSSVCDLVVAGLIGAVAGLIGGTLSLVGRSWMGLTLDALYSSLLLAEASLVRSGLGRALGGIAANAPQNLCGCLQ